MSISVVSSNKVYANIEDLTENMGISNGDRFIIQTDGGTVLFDYENLRIDLEHTTFGTAFGDLLQFQSTAAEFVQRITEEFTEAQGDISVLRTDVDTIQSQIDSIKLMLSLVMGSKNGESEDSIEIERQKLPVDGQKYMAEIYGAVREEKDADFSLTFNNLMNIRRSISSTADDTMSELDSLKQNIDAQDKVIADFYAMIQSLPFYRVGDIKWTFDGKEPDGFLKMNGQWVDNQQYRMLHDHLEVVLGSQFRTNDGMFQIPDMSGAFPRVVNESGVKIDSDTFGGRVEYKPAEGMVAGQLVKPMLPNITGSIAQDDLVSSYASGAFERSSSAGYGSKNEYTSRIVTFDASRSDSIYKEGVHDVVPYSMGMYAYIKF